jgi:hypothetical protein
MSERKKVWVCAACGRVKSTREGMTDEACWLKAFEAWEDTVKYDPNTGFAVRAEAAKAGAR